MKLSIFALCLVCAGLRVSLGDDRASVSAEEFLIDTWRNPEGDILVFLRAYDGKLLGRHRGNDSIWAPTEGVYTANTSEGEVTFHLALASAREFWIGRATDELSGGNLALKNRGKESIYERLPLVA